MSCKPPVRRLLLANIAMREISDAFLEAARRSMRATSAVRAPFCPLRTRRRSESDEAWAAAKRAMRRIEKLEIECGWSAWAEGVNHEQP